MTTIVRMDSLMRSDMQPGGISRSVVCFVLSLLLVSLTGCAVSSTTVMDEEVVSNQKYMSSYKSLIIRDFELKSELYTDSPDSQASERDRRYARIPAELAENIERYVKSRRTYRVVTRSGQPTDTTLVLKGKFTRVSRFRISITGTLHDGASDQEVAYFRQTLWDVFDTTEAVNLLSREVADFIDRIQYK